MSESKFDYLIVGAGLYGAVFARIMTDAGKKCLVIDRRDHIAGNIYSEKIENIEVHKYGPHIFHTDNEDVWEFLNRFTKFNHFVYSPVANYKGELYNLPFNMNTFSKMWNITTPSEAKEIIKKQRKESGIKEPANLEEQALTLVGRDIYEKLIKGYTEKQWGKDCKDLPAFIIKRLPLRFIFDNNYFNHPHQGIPINGYTDMLKNMLDGIKVRLGVDYLKEKNSLNALADNIVYTGTIDEFFDYKLGTLEYRSLRFETEVFDMQNYQGVAGMNYTDRETPYTRVIEHKHFVFEDPNPKKTVITREYSKVWQKGDEPYYAVNDEKNNSLYEEYKKLAVKEVPNVIFGGRLGLYKYMDMDKVIAAAMEKCKEIIGQEK